MGDTTTLDEVRDYLAHLAAGHRNADVWLRALVDAVAERDADIERLRIELREARPSGGNMTPVAFERIGGQAFAARAVFTTPTSTGGQ